ncbi:nucleolin-like [Melanotaenia boesemani]|uniref:nucleolin-like n=1 Tax=Melanotaenia boesemani TaxID=1250792 RepID=UPI001C047370|nr:nucleolin-like [Melanotaenia boesemani]
MVVCLVRRRRRNTQQPIALSQIQMDGRDRKTDDEDEDDEQDYENVDLLDMTKKVRKEETEEESDDYEEPVGDDDHDYEEAGPDLYCTNAKEINVCGEDYGEEDNEDNDEEEESSDEDDDYENVSPACEQIVDINQQYEDVYQTF